MVIFHSYVSLPEGISCKKPQALTWRSGAQDPSAGDSKTHPKDRGAGSGL